MKFQNQRLCISSNTIVRRYDVSVNTVCNADDDDDGHDGDADDDDDDDDGDDDDDDDDDVDDDDDADDGDDDDEDDDEEEEEGEDDYGNDDDYLKNVEVLVRGVRFKPQRLVAEAVEITRHHSVNRIEGVDLVSLWKAVLDKPS
ncbi:hypothetical protein T265_07470 [Opisthorchis viverrini]|uniref:Uncharacterized protein n=1 Tax=Opisthorchis viverrini TaxID=6198 RepID=A0A074ZCD7_OPIVI|nr:hypothetical protein T265_07470 [Opisthorchis viverrini]KER24961.1 hypothetical protein T265_07470 [Opisthorchis viverrini]